MSGKDTSDFVLMNFIPACPRDIVIDIHKAWMQVSREGVALVEDQGDAVIAVAGCVEDFAIQPNAGKEFPALFNLQDVAVILPDLNIGILLGLEELRQLWDVVQLALPQDKFDALVFQLLYHPGVVRVKVGDKKPLDLFE